MKNLKKLFVLLPLYLFSLSTFGQDEYGIKESPYQLYGWGDVAWVGGGIGLNVLGFSFIQNKDKLSLDDYNNLDKDDIWGIDRWAAGNNDERASEISDIPFYTSFTLPLLFLLNKDSRSHSGQIGVMFVETMATTGALFTITAGLVGKSRPLVYDENISERRARSANNQRSFFSGHVAASAAASFFAAQVYSDFFPDSKAKPYIWAGAAAIPAVVGYYRLKSGNHFLTDNIIGYAIGAASGMLVPILHRKGNDNLRVSPGIGFRTQTLRMTYTF